LVLPACLAVLVVTGAARAEDDKSAGGSKDVKGVDGLIYTNLREVINHGADLYNSGDWNGCYRLWEGALMSLKPLLAHRPDLQKAIETGLTNAQQDPMLYQRAFVLRKVLDQVRTDLKGNAPKTAQEKPLTKPKPKDNDNTAVKPKPKKTLWDRLGGEKGVTQIVDDTVNSAADDPKVDFFRHGKVKLDAAQVAKMKREIVEQISQNTGGPLKYTGPDMKTVHKGMGITNEQFDAMMGHVKKSLQKNKVSPQDTATIVAALNTYREQIVQPKKPDEKKPADKKPIDKKPVDKKPDDKKPVDKKPVDKKPVDKKPVDKKPDDKKPVDKKPDDKKPVDKKPDTKKPGTTGLSGQTNPAGTASISGHVTFKGKPLTGGTIEFVGEAGKSKGPIGADGTFDVKGVKAGAYTVILSTKGAKTPVAIPASYGTAATSGLRYTVKEGRQTFDIDLQ